MPSTHSPEGRLLDRARKCVEDDGVIPLDVAADLMQQGMIVNTIERKMRRKAGY